MSSPRRPRVDDSAIQAIETIIQYKFKDPYLPMEALQKCSKTSTYEGNLRLAIVGDSVMQLILAKDWYLGTTNRKEWSDTLSSVVSNANLYRIAWELGLERFIEGSISKETMKATVQALLGAVFLDSNLETVKDVMDSLDLLPKEKRLKRELDVGGVGSVKGDLKDVNERRPEKRSRL